MNIFFLLLDFWEKEDEEVLPRGVRSMGVSGAVSGEAP
jgi:hypothetical protein